MKVLSSTTLVLGVGLATMACSGRYNVGFEPMPQGAAGESEASGGTKNEPVASGGSATSGGSSTETGGTDVGPAGGQGVDVTPPRCGFKPDAASSTPTTSATTEVVAQRIARFLNDNDTVDLPPNLPVRANPAWASAQAMAMLDDHVANGTEAAGLVRFLTSWLKIGNQEPGLMMAHTWSLKLLDPQATLSTLLAEPTGVPHRLGILTDIELLKVRPTITRRGVWMMEQLFCVSVPPPPPSVGELPEQIDGTTRRERLESNTSSPSCNTCHEVVDPAGDSLEHFDAAGNYSELDSGVAVDAAATIMPANVSFDDFDALAPQLAQSCEVAQCFTKAVMADAFGTTPTFTEAESNHVANAFADSGFSIRVLVKAVVTTPSFLR